MKKYTYIVLSDAIEGREDEFNEWYSNVHLPDALKVPGVVAAQRFKFAASRWEGAEQTLPTYLAIYEVETDDVFAVGNEIRARAGTAAMVTCDAMDIAQNRSGYYEPITERMLK